LGTLVEGSPPAGRHRSAGARARRRDVDARRAAVRSATTGPYERAFDATDVLPRPGPFATGAEPADPLAADGSGLGGKVRRGLVISLLNTLIGRAGSIVSGIVLARLLVPEDFGVFAVGMVALAAVLSLNELGVSLALVRWPGDPRTIAPTVTTISVASSALLYAGCFVGAGPFAAALGAPDAAGVVRLLCLSVLIDGLTATPAQLLAREFRQGSRLVVDLTTFVLTTGLTIGLATTGTGAWSLAWGQLAGNLVGAVVLFRFAALWPRLGFDRRLARELLSFGLPLAGASLLLFTMLNVDYIVAGSMLGPLALGFYLQAFNLSSWPVNVFSVSVRRVSLAAFSRLQDRPADLAAALARSVTLLSAVTLPVCVLLGLLAQPLVTTVYGSRWAPAGAALQWLAVLGLVRVLTELLYDYLVAAGRSRSTLVLQGLWTGLLVVSLPIGASIGGIGGIALGHALIGLLVILPAYGAAVVRLGTPARLLVAPLARPLAGTAAIAAAVLAVRAVAAPGFGQLALAGIAALAVYLPFVAPLRHLLREPISPAPSPIPV
jgi:O-antigen/teichoic acid export membrane protein